MHTVQHVECIRLRDGVNWKMDIARTAPLMIDGKKLPGKEKARLLAGLEKFANLGDGLEDYLSFAGQSPEFWPVEILDQHDHAITWTRACHKVVLIYRDSLRRLWRLEPAALHDESLSLLMGVSHYLLSVNREDVASEISLVSGSGFPLMPRWGIWGQAWKEVFEAHPNAWVLSAGLSPSWQTGEFEYRPWNDFQRAVYLLFRERWRAKVCLQCGAFFVAKRPPQFYCSNKCFGEVRRNRNLLWWKQVGSRNRKARAAKARKKGDN